LGSSFAGMADDAGEAGGLDTFTPPPGAAYIGPGSDAAMAGGEVGTGGPLAGVAPGEHALQSAWSLYYDVKTKGSSRTNYLDKIKTLGTFNTVEGFWRHYVHLKRPSQLGSTIFNYYLFRDGDFPMWENYPVGGCWIIKIRRSSDAGSGVLSKLWQDLVFGAIGEQFKDPGVVGVTLARRPKEDMLSVWNSDGSPAVRFSIGEEMKRILALESGTLIEYKFHSRSMVDKSTYSNAQAYVYTGPGGRGGGDSGRGRGRGGHSGGRGGGSGGKKKGGRKGGRGGGAPRPPRAQPPGGR